MGSQISERGAVNLGLGNSGQQQPQPASSGLPPGSPATLSEMRELLAVVDSKLAEANRMGGRIHFTRKEVLDLLLDVRSLLDRMTAPITLINMAQQISQENRALRESLGE